MDRIARQEKKRNEFFAELFATATAIEPGLKGQFMDELIETPVQTSFKILKLMGTKDYQMTFTELETMLYNEYRKSLVGTSAIFSLQRKRLEKELFMRRYEERENTMAAKVGLIKNLAPELTNR